MNVAQILLTLQAIVSLLLIAVILLQAQGTGLGTTWGGGGESYHTKRGVERVMFAITIALIVLFGILSLVSVVLT